MVRRTNSTGFILHISRYHFYFLVIFAAYYVVFYAFKISMSGYSLFGMQSVNGFNRHGSYPKRVFYQILGGMEIVAVNATLFHAWQDETSLIPVFTASFSAFYDTSSFINS